MEWSDIDLDDRICYINKNLTLTKKRDKNWKAVKRETLVGQTKTYSGKREIPLNDRAMQALTQIMEYNKRMHVNTPYVVSTDTCDHVSERNLLRTLEYILGAIGAKHIGLHGLRHTFSSTLLRKGIEVSVVSKLLGHKDISTTYKTYIHIIEEQKKNAMFIIPSI